MSRAPRDAASANERLATRAALLAAASWLACGLGILGARRFWPGEILAGFDWQLGLAGLLLAGVFAALRQGRLALVMAALAGLTLAPTLRLYLPRRSPAAHGPAFELTACNLRWKSRGINGELERWFRKLDSDIYVISEVSSEHLALFEALADVWPHQHLTLPTEEFNPGTWATAILSRLPFDERRAIPIGPGPADAPETVDPDGWIRPALEVRVSVDGDPILVRGVHPMRPGKPRRLYARARVLETLATESWAGASLLAGDLNLPPASPWFRGLLSRTGLRDSRVGFGRQPSFLVTTKLPGPGLSIVLDHVLTSADLTVLERRTESIPGSDHRAVTAVLAHVR